MVEHSDLDQLKRLWADEAFQTASADATWKLSADTVALPATPGQGPERGALLILARGRSPWKVSVPSSSSSAAELVAGIVPLDLWTGSRVQAILPIPYLFLACFALLAAVFGFMLVQRVRFGRVVWGISLADGNRPDQRLDP